jgi:hypothetical protein
MLQPKYSFDPAVDKHIEKCLGKKWFKKSNYQRGPTVVFLEHWEYPSEVEFTIKQKSGSIRVSYGKPKDPKHNELSDYVPKLLAILKSCIRRGSRSTRRKQRGGQVTYTPLEGRAIGDPDAIPTVASETYYKKDGYSDFPASNNDS